MKSKYSDYFTFSKMDYLPHDSMWFFTRERSSKGLLFTLLLFLFLFLLLLLLFLLG
jgi:hypothetical protein